MLNHLVLNKLTVIHLIFLLAFSLSAYNQSELFVMTDQPFYASGEVMAFKIHNPSQTPAPIIHVELVDRNSKVVGSSIVRSQGQIAFGQIEIPLDVSSDWYLLRSYSIWLPSMGIKDVNFKAVSVYNSFDNTPIQEYSRLYAERPEPASFEIEVSTKKNIHTIRDNVDLEIHLSNENGQPVQANCSISVMEAALMDFPATIMPLSIDPTSVMEEATDGDQAQQKLTYSGRLESDIQNILLGVYIAEDRRINWTFLNDNQEFSVSLDDFNKDRSAQLFGMEPTGSIFYFEPNERQVGHQIPAVSLPEQLPYTESVTEYLKDARSRLIIEDIFFESASRNSDGAEKLPDFFEPDRSFSIEDYIRFVNTEEFVDEVVSSVRVRQNDEGKPVFQILMENKSYSRREPLMFLNGFMVRSADEILSIPVNDLDRIELFRKNETLIKHFGSVGRNGVIAAFTKNPFQKPVNSNNWIVKGLSARLPVKTPAKVSESVDRPILSPLIYWNASINTNAQGRAGVSFNTTDDKAPYLVVVRAIDENGQKAQTQFPLHIEGNQNK